MLDFFPRTDLKFDRQHGRSDGDLGVFGIRRKDAKSFEHTDAPWADDPMSGAGLWSAYWSLLEPGGSIYLSFVYHWEDQPGATRANLPTKVFVIRFGFEGLLYTRTTMTTAEFDRAVKKYHLLRELFRGLGCDELTGVDGNAGDPLNPRYSDPAYGGWCFRFSRVGNQVLIRAMEERQMPPPNTDPDFIFVDPT